MTKEEILKKAIEKATKGGYKEPLTPNMLHWHILSNNYFEIIFSLSFAEAFWGEKTKNIEVVRGYNVNNPVWWGHLEKMILEEEPLKYLEKFLNKEGKNE